MDSTAAETFLISTNSFIHFVVVIYILLIFVQGINATWLHSPNKITMVCHSPGLSMDGPGLT